MWIRIQALDTLFFRDGKPFSQGEETWADSVFPPPPSIFYGALRSLYFSQHPNEFTALAQQDPTEKLRVSAFYFEDGNLRYVPTPRDVVVFNKGQEEEYYAFLQCVDHALHSAPTPRLLMPPDTFADAAEDPPELLELSAYQDYLQGNLKNWGFAPIPYLAEPKIGIGRDDLTRVTGEDGRLYRVDMIRLASRKARLHKPEKFGFLLEFNGLELPSGKGILKLGGEHKAAQYEIFQALEDVTVFSQPAPAEFLKLCLLTPAIFNNGWCPIFPENTRLIAAAVGKPQYIGGFDMKARQPKPMYRAVPAGSVYYLQCAENAQKTLLDEWHGKAISQIYPEQGFGLACVGQWTETDNTA